MIAVVFEFTGTAREGVRMKGRARNREIVKGERILKVDDDGEGDDDDDVKIRKLEVVLHSTW